MANPEPDNRNRPDFGVLFSLLEEPDGHFRMIVDELRRDPDDWRRWENHAFITHARYPADQLIEYDFTQEQFAEMGRGLIATLVAGLSVRAKKERPDQGEN